MKLFKRKKHELEKLPKNTLAVTGEQTTKGTEVNIFVHDQLTNGQFQRIMLDLILNLLMDLIVRFNLDVQVVIDNLTSDLKRTHHEYIQKETDEDGQQ